MKKVLCIGHATYDITFPIEFYPEENTKNKVYEKIECGGGSSANVAVLLSRWGEKTYFLGTVSNDIFGDKIKEDFKLNKVSTKYLFTKKTIKTSLSFIMANIKNGKRTVMTYKDKNLKSINQNILFKPDIIFCDGEESDQAIKIIKRNKKAIKIIDAGALKEGTIKLCPLMDYIVSSKDFAENYTSKKIDFDNIQTLIDIHKELEKEFNNQIIITLEEKGSFSKINDEYKLIPSIKVKPLDSTGAGDIYHGAFTYFLTHGYDLEKTMHLSNITGALSVTKLGSRNSIPELKEVLKYDR